MSKGISLEKEWFLLKTKTWQEKRAMENLLRQHVDCYCPEALVEKIIRGKKSQVIETLNPRSSASKTQEESRVLCLLEELRHGCLLHLLKS